MSYSEANQLIFLSFLVHVSLSPELGRNEGKTLEEEHVLPGNTLTVVVAPRQRCDCCLAVFQD